jgi:hypothetical protein
MISHYRNLTVPCREVPFVSLRLYSSTYDGPLEGHSS